MKIESTYAIGTGKQNIIWSVVLIMFVLCGISDACWNPPNCTQPCTYWNGTGCVNYCTCSACWGCNTATWECSVEKCLASQCKDCNIVNNNCLGCKSWCNPEKCETCVGGQ